MLTLFLSAVCALGLNASSVMVQADTLDRYIVNGENVEKFDGSQLVGKTVSDYKVTMAQSNVDGGAVRIHLIRTDGQKIKDIKAATSVESTGANDKGSKNANVTVLSTTTIFIVDGKKCDKEALNKIKPESIASMTVNKPGSKEAIKLSGKKDVAVVEVVTK